MLIQGHHFTSWLKSNRALEDKRIGVFYIDILFACFFLSFFLHQFLSLSYHNANVFLTISTKSHSFYTLIHHHLFRKLKKKCFRILKWNQPLTKLCFQTRMKKTNNLFLQSSSTCVLWNLDELYFETSVRFQSTSFLESLWSFFQKSTPTNDCNRTVYIVERDACVSFRIWYYSLHNNEQC